MIAHAHTRVFTMSQYPFVWEFLRNGRHCDCKHVFGKNSNYEQAQLRATWVLSCVPEGRKKKSLSKMGNAVSNVTGGI